MGNHHSNLRVTARLTVQGEGCPVDGITLSYVRRRSFCGRRRRRLVAAFTFPRNGWGQVSTEGTRHNTSLEAAVVPLDDLRKKDGSRAVQMICLSDGVPVYRTEVTVADLLQRLDLTTRGKEAAVFFSLSGGKTEEGNTQAHTYTALFCNGRRCGDGGAATPADTAYRHQAQPGGEAVDCQNKWSIFEGATASDWTYEDDEAMALDRDVIEEKWNKFEEATASDWVCEDAEAMALDRDAIEEKWNKFEAATASDWTFENDEAMALDRDGMEQKEEEGVFCRVNGSPPAHSGDCPPGWRGITVKDSLGYIASVVAVILFLYNAWLEYSRD